MRAEKTSRSILAPAKALCGGFGFIFPDAPGTLPCAADRAKNKLGKPAKDSRIFAHFTQCLCIPWKLPRLFLPAL